MLTTTIQGSESQQYAFQAEFSELFPNSSHSNFPNIFINFSFSTKVIPKLSNKVGRDY